MIHFLYAFFLRLYGALGVIPLAMLGLSLFGWWGTRRKKELAIWLVAFALSIIGWRLMWLGSLNGRADRYYMLWGVSVMLLVRPALLGVVRIGNLLHITAYLKLPMRIWWGLLALTIVIVNVLNVGCHGQQKTFLPHVAQDIVEFRDQHKNEKIVLLDTTYEFGRIRNARELSDLPIVQVLQRKFINEREFNRDFLEKLLPVAREYDTSLLFVRQQKEQREFECGKVTGGCLPLRIVSEYPFRSFVYTLYVMKLVDLYSSDDLQIIRDYDNQSIEIKIQPKSDAQISVREVFPEIKEDNLIAHIRGNNGYVTSSRWMWLAKDAQTTSQKTIELTFSLYNHRFLPIAKRTVKVGFDTDISAQVLGNKNTDSGKYSVTQMTEGEVSEIPNLPDGTRVMFFGSGVTDLDNLSKKLPNGIRAVQTNQSDCSERNSYSYSFSRMLLQEKENPYFIDGKLMLAGNPPDAVVFLLGNWNCMRWGASDLFTMETEKQYLADMKEVIRQLNKNCPSMQIILGTIPMMQDNPVPLLWDRYGEANIRFYNTAAERLNRKIRQVCNDSSLHHVYVLPLDYCFNADAADSMNVWNLTKGGREQFWGVVKKQLQMEK